MSERQRRWDECSGDPCICPKPTTPLVRALPDLPLRTEVARIAATLDALASLPCEDKNAPRLLGAVANSLRSALENTK